MPIYRIYLLDAQGHVARPAIEVDCADDAGACREARACAHDQVAEVWEGTRMVAQIEPDPT